MGKEVKCAKERPYWAKEIPEVRFFGRKRLAYYKKAGVLQVSLVRQENDGTILIGKTICIYKDEADRGNLPVINFLIDIFHDWRKHARGTDEVAIHFDSGEVVVLPDSTALDSVDECGQGNVNIEEQSSTVDTVPDTSISNSINSESVDTEEDDVKLLSRTIMSELASQAKRRKLKGVVTV